MPVYTRLSVCDRFDCEPKKMMCLDIWKTRKLFAACSSGWIRFKRSCYKYVNEPEQFDGAKSRCLRMGARLVHIESKAEDNFIRVLYLTLGLRKEKEKTWLSLFSSRENPTFRRLFQYFWHSSQTFSQGAKTQIIKKYTFKWVWIKMC